MMDLNWMDFSLVETRTSAVLNSRLEAAWTALCDFGNFGEYLASIGMQPLSSKLLVGEPLVLIARGEGELPFEHASDFYTVCDRIRTLRLIDEQK